MFYLLIVNLCTSWVGSADCTHFSKVLPSESICEAQREEHHEEAQRRAPDIIVVSGCGPIHTP